MLLIPQREENRIKSVVPAECLLLFWNKQITACDKMYFDSISRDKLGERDNCILLIRKPLLHVLRQLLIYLDAGLLCRHMHILKQQEIILVLRGFYTKPELASFFSGTSGVGRKWNLWKNLPVCVVCQNALSTASSKIVLTRAPINGCRNGRLRLFVRKSVIRMLLSGK